MTKFVDITLTGLIFTTAILFTVFVVLFLNGWAFSKLWGWFIVPVFHAPALSIVQAIGVIVFWRLSGISGGIKSLFAKDDDEEELIITIFRLLVEGVASSLSAVGIGWIVLQFM